MARSDVQGLKQSLLTSFVGLQTLGLLLPSPLTSCRFSLKSNIKFSLAPHLIEAVSRQTACFFDLLLTTASLLSMIWSIGPLFHHLVGGCIDLTCCTCPSSGPARFSLGRSVALLTLSTAHDTSHARAGKFSLNPPSHTNNSTRRQLNKSAAAGTPALHQQQQLGRDLVVNPAANAAAAAPAGAVTAHGKGMKPLACGTRAGAPRRRKRDQLTCGAASGDAAAEVPSAKRKHNLQQASAQDFQCCSLQQEGFHGVRSKTAAEADHVDADFLSRRVRELVQDVGTAADSARDAIGVSKGLPLDDENPPDAKVAVGKKWVKVSAADLEQLLQKQEQQEDEQGLQHQGQMQQERKEGEQQEQAHQLQQPREQRQLHLHKQQQQQEGKAKEHEQDKQDQTPQLQQANEQQQLQAQKQQEQQEEEEPKGHKQDKPHLGQLLHGKMFLYEEGFNESLAVPTSSQGVELKLLRAAAGERLRR